MKQTAIVLVACLAFTGAAVADAAIIERCEQALIDRLKAPRSYERISATHTVLRELMPPEQRAHIVNFVFYALNPMGVELRGRAECTIDNLNNAGQPLWVDFLD